MLMYLRGVERLIVTACVPLLLYIGYRLFLTGVSGEMKITAKMSKWSGSATAVAPGSLCFMLGVALGCYVMFAKVTFANGSVGSGTTSFLGGGAQASLPLSIRLKIALGEFFLCQTNRPPSDSEICTTKFQNDFKSIPTEKDLTQIQRIEIDISRGTSPSAPDEYLKQRLTFEK